MKDRRTSERLELALLPKAVAYVPDDCRKIAIDGGANVGHWSLQLARYFDLVFAFEPVAFTLEALRKNLAADLLGRHVTACGAALFDHDCTLEMQHPLKRSASTAYFALISKTGVVPGLTIDGLGLEECGLIKLDLEGAELRALVGAHMTLERCRPVLIVECVPKQLARYNDTIGQLHAYLELHGYRLVLYQSPNRVYIPC